MSSIGLANSLSPTAAKRSVILRFCAGTGFLLSLAGCVSAGTYETARLQADNIKTELNAARTEIQTLEQQKEALHKLTLEGETVLAGIRTELQKARESYAQHKAKLSRLSALQDKARTLDQQHHTYTQDIKTAKKNAVKMQTVINRYEREIGLVPGRVESLKVSQPFETSSDTSKLVATVSPLSATPPPTSLAPASSLPQSDPTPSAVPPVGTIAVSSRSSNVSALPAPSQPSKPVSANTASTTPAALPQQPTEDSWIGSLRGWFSSLWDWFFLVTSTNPVHRISYSSTQSLIVGVALPLSIPMAARSSAGDVAHAGHDRIANPQPNVPLRLDEIR